MDWIRVWITVALWFCGLLLSLLGYIAGKREKGEPFDLIKFGKSAALTAAGAVGAAAIWPVSGWEWAPGDAVTVLASGFGLNAGLSKSFQVLFPKRTV